MDEKIEQALATERTIDITTTGRKTGQPRRIEIWFHNLDGAIYITGRPGRQRHWYANMVANPDFTFHLKQSVQADIPATATPIEGEADRRAVLSRILKKIDVEPGELDEWVQNSPLVEVTLRPAGGGG